MLVEYKGPRGDSLSNKISSCEDEDDGERPSPRMLYTITRRHYTPTTNNMP